jgi:hypothetical protein
VRWLGLVVAVIVGAVLLPATAEAHVVAGLSDDRAGAADVRMTMRAESEDAVSGIVSVRVALPSPLVGAAVQLVSGPVGWTLRPDRDGYSVSGKALPVGVDARLVVMIPRLPDSPAALVFRTVVAYADGRTDSWTEEPTAAHPAPVISLRPANDPATPTAAAAATQSTGSGISPNTWATVAVAALVLAVGCFLLARRLRRAR